MQLVKKSQNKKMKGEFLKMCKDSKGITLIALVITTVISYDNIKKRWYNKVFAPMTFLNYKINATF